MSFPLSDPKGYYAALGLKNTAQAVDIKKAYHLRAKELHPDHNSSPDATVAFQSVVEAYRVLSDSDQKAFYDAQCQGKAVNKASIASPTRYSMIFWTGLCVLVVVCLFVFYLPWGATDSPPPDTRKNDVVVVLGDSRPPPAIGELRHVQTDRLRIYEEPDKTSPLRTVLERFATIQIIGLTEQEHWVLVRTPGGLSGYAQIYALFPGPGEGPKSRRCWDGLDAPDPANGEVLLRRGMGERSLDIRNLTKSDALVKLGSANGVTFLTVFVQAGTEVTVPGIPDNIPLRATFATGRHYSAGCMAFLTDFAAYALSWRLSSAERTSTPLVLSLSFATPLSIERFLSDEPEEP